MSRTLRRVSPESGRRVRACTFESMPLATDPQILEAVERVYSTDLGLPDDWDDVRRTAFTTHDAEVITWMVWAEAGTIGDRSIADWTRRSGGKTPDQATRAALMAEARRLASIRVLDTQLYEQIAEPD